MKALIQRVREGNVTISGTEYSRIGNGFVVFLGIRRGDSKEAAKELAERCANLRVFEDEGGKMNRSLRETNGSVLIVSQFTLYADTRKGNRPGFSEAAAPAEAEPLYETFVEEMSALLGAGKVRTGMFRAMMDVGIVNDGPVTIMLEDKQAATGNTSTNGGGR